VTTSVIRIAVTIPCVEPVLTVSDFLICVPLVELDQLCDGLWRVFERLQEIIKTVFELIRFRSQLVIINALMSHLRPRSSILFILGIAAVMSSQEGIGIE
jgi:hypothetical protein